MREEISKNTLNCIRQFSTNKLTNALKSLVKNSHFSIKDFNLPR